MSYHCVAICHVNLCNIANSNNKNVSIFPLIRHEAEETLCAPMEYTDPEFSSFTLMLEEPKSNHDIRMRKAKKNIQFNNNELILIPEMKT